jgi:hypothetical protein
MAGPAAREYGDNDENRANRQSLNKEIEVLARSTNAEIATREVRHFRKCAGFRTPG